MMNEREQTTESEVVHQLKNQLGIVISYAELIIDATPADDPVQADLIIIQQAARDALELTANLISK